MASWQGINVERILALKPDLILAWRGGNPQRPLDQLAALGIPIFYSDPTHIDQIASDLDKLAQYSPHPEQAHQAAEQFRQHVNTLRDRYARSQPKRTFCNSVLSHCLPAPGTPYRVKSFHSVVEKIFCRQPGSLATSQS